MPLSAHPKAAALEDRAEKIQIYFHVSRLRQPYSVDRGLCELDLKLGDKAKGATHLVCAKSALDIPRIRAVADLIVEDFAKSTLASKP